MEAASETRNKLEEAGGLERGAGLYGKHIHFNLLHLINTGVATLNFP